MIANSVSTQPCTVVAIDVAKQIHEVLVEPPTGRRQRWRVGNCQADFVVLRDRLRAFETPVLIGFEATGNYHRPLAYYLGQCGFQLRLISSLAVARTRDALYNSWDKNDPKDTQVVLHLLKTGISQRYHDPLVHRTNDLQELSQTHYQISLRKVQIQHSIMTHYLPLYFPEAERYYTNSRAQWFTQVLHRFPCPAAITCYSQDAFEQEAWTLVGRKVNKRGFLADLYGTASQSIGLAVTEDSQAIQMFRVILAEHQHLCATRAAIEHQADQTLQSHPDYQRLRTVPGVGPILALTILAEAGDLRRFPHYRQFLKFCGFDLSTQQSGQFRGLSRLSKHGNARLRYAFWMAANGAVRMRQNTFRDKYARYIRADPQNPDRKRKALCAVAAKVARVAHGLIKTGTDYRPYFEALPPSGALRSRGPSRQVLTS
ncbi:MAG: IS110 family transposase [Nitrospira sp.]|nr:IS110 family transposase [Nitrospira sp.]MDR4469438.1 IS110 family transposase [Nitrospira sp.]MDR4470600.1 IS110 family transposase [Nitrospira sp.]